MTTYTAYTDGSTVVKSGAARSIPIGGVLTILENDFDATRKNLAQNDVMELISIPAKTLVLATQWEVLVVEGASRNFAIGDGSSTTALLASTSANSATSGTTLALTEGTPNTATRYYTAADTVDLLAVTSGGLTTCKVRIKLVCVCF